MLAELVLRSLMCAYLKTTIPKMKEFVVLLSRKSHDWFLVVDDNVYHIDAM